MVRATSKNRRNGVEARLHPMLGDSLYGSIVFSFTLRSITYYSLLLEIIATSFFSHRSRTKSSRRPWYISTGGWPAHSELNFGDEHSL